MARIQPSFFHFYLFQARQHNTSFLPTSKDEIKYPGGGLSKTTQTFINSANNISPSRTIQNRVHKFSGTYEIGEILHIYLIP